jgi:hypothetical protein
MMGMLWWWGQNLVMGVLLGVPAAIGSVVVHELGHAVAALTVGCRVTLFELGKGETILMDRILWGAHVVVRAIPIAAGVATEPRLVGMTEFQRMVSSGGGAGANLLLALALVWFPGIPRFVALVSLVVGLMSMSPLLGNTDWMVFFPALKAVLEKYLAST